MSNQTSEIILVVDDEPSICKLIKNILRIKYYEVLVANNGQEALNMLKQNDNILAVIADIRMPKMDGELLLKEVRKLFPDIPVIIITGYGTIDNAVELMKQGADYYISKPFSEEKLLDVVNNSISNNRNKQKLSMDIITADPQMLSIIEMIDTAAKKDRNTSFFIQGESGTGKELIAKRIHNINNPFNGSFVAINCAAIVETLFENELFGHERGAYTGAVSGNMGKFEIAHRGTIFLDEITEMPLPMQAKLLRVLQEGEINRIGSSSPIKVDVRVIATTNKNIKNEVAEGKFRSDLFYRLYVIPIVIPPLRNRKGDIKLLANYFLGKFSQLIGSPETIISEETMNALESYSWPGNVRELENAIRRAMFLCRGNTLSIKDFLIEDCSNIFSSIPQSFDNLSIHDIEKHIILNTLEKVNGDRSRAAEILGITTRTIYNKLQKYMVK